MFNDGVLELAWILTEKSEAELLSAGLAERFGSVVYSNDEYKVFSSGDVALRAEPPEVLVATPELIRDITGLGGFIAEQTCKDLRLEWITPWNPKLRTLRKLPAWADYVLSITETGEIQAANLLDASAKGIWKLGSSKKVLRVLLAQKITATGSVLQCHETLYFYKDPQIGKSMMPGSRCSQSPELCVKS